ncbi:hypothetical protein TL16_g08033 [Triparma laevis f. inornata]|uniref:Uncharacterized protein n=1 Tax=Triparma laevis f. inornata TaxID=1714386 RepID=A0A9W7AVJ7_9STRA|nr:hypothetical protein TL16_g08033 [Triparma laevis f. inornata]
MPSPTPLSNLKPQKMKKTWGNPPSKLNSSFELGPENPLRAASSKDMFSFNIDDKYTSDSVRQQKKLKNSMGCHCNLKTASLLSTLIFMGCIAGAFFTGALDDLLGINQSIDPSSSSSPIPVMEGENYFKKSNSNELFYLEHLSSSGADIPLGRSYGGNDWEGVQPNAYIFVCDKSNACSINLPKGKYQVKSIDLSGLPDHEDAQAARSLSHATFGATHASIAAFQAPGGSHASKLKNFLSKQFSLPPSLHRAYYRARANIRVVMNGLDAGEVLPPCAQNARYHQFAFTNSDIGKTVTLDSSGGTTVILVDGEVRTEVGASIFNDDEPSVAPWVICTVVEAIGGKITFGQGCDGKTDNQAVTFETSSPPAEHLVFSAAASSFVDLAPVPEPDVKILKDGVERTCGVDFASSTTKFALAQPSTYYIFDPRVVHAENIVENPANNQAGGGKSCTNVPRTFLNVDDCVTETSACAPLEYSSEPITLNAATLPKFYEKAGKHVHYVEGLKMDNVESLCTSKSSRFIKRESNVCDGDATSEEVKTAIQTAITESTDANTDIVDIDVRSSCSGSVVGAKVMVSGHCYEHTHVDEHGVFDFTYWSFVHDGNAVAYKEGRENPIAQFALDGSAKLTFPGWHTAGRWDFGVKDIQRNAIIEVGKLGDVIEFSMLPEALQLDVMAEHFGVTVGGASAGGIVACGSPGEVASDPSLGYRYSTGILYTNDQAVQASKITDQKMSQTESKQMVWTNLALKADDQLRQRVAWALSQILVVSSDGATGTSETEKFVQYYDIFVRHAFGNFRDVLREVSYSPTMGTMLSYLGSKSFANMLKSSGNEVFPDENYARELMQLFTIGLFRLNMDGTHELKDDGQAVASYDNDAIITFARVWTGFQRQASRGGIEMSNGDGSVNNIDPMKIRPDHHDFFPKVDTMDGYLGDATVLCSDLAAGKAFLKAGAEYRYLGRVNQPEMQTAHKQMVDKAAYAASQNGKTLKEMDLMEGESELYGKLCGAVESDGKCQFESRVVLDADLTCYGDECEIQQPRVVRVNTTDATSGEIVPTFYEYIQNPCVELTFYNNATLVTSHRGPYRGISNSGKEALCANPENAVAVATCCSSSNRAWWTGGGGALGIWKFTGERVSHELAKERCAPIWEEEECLWDLTDYDFSNALWTNRDCSIQIQVNPDGLVSRVDNVGPNGKYYVMIDNRNYFLVRWEGGVYPKVKDDCRVGDWNEGDCRVHESEIGAFSCICNVTVENEMVFGWDERPSRDDVLEKLKIGHMKEVGTEKVWGDVAGYEIADEMGNFSFSSFKVVDDHGRTIHVKNLASTVRVGGGGSGYGFRNPPNFNNLVEPTQRDALHEVDALIDHLFHHQNTAPFISHQLIQRLVTSNPSPRYIKVVAEAFTSGTYEGFGSGEYGDLEAAVAAIMMDREASSKLLDGDPSHGLVREPILKILHYMKSMEYVAGDEDSEIHLKNMEDVMGQIAWESPTVFNFYEPKYIPAMLANHGLHSPESQLLNAPFTVGLLNGLTSLIRYGLTRCWGGFAYDSRTTCTDVDNGIKDPEELGNVAGFLTWRPTPLPEPVATAAPTMAPAIENRTCVDDNDWRRWNPDAGVPYGGQTCVKAAEGREKGQTWWCMETTTAYIDEFGRAAYEACPVACGSCPFVVEGLIRGEQVVEELSLLLTSGRLSDKTRSIIVEEYETELRRYGDEGRALRLAQQLFAFSPEFHTTNKNEVPEDAEIRKIPADNEEATVVSDYKAIVYLMMFGAADSYSFLVPHSGCGDKDMYGDYSQVRGNAALGKHTLLQIDAEDQVCSKFGLHPSFKHIKQMYEDGDAAWIANVGVLSEPVTRNEYHAKSNKLPPSLFAHNHQAQALHTSNPHDSTGSGWLGRVKDVLIEKGMTVGSYSISGTAKVLETDVTTAADVLSRSTGVIPFDEGGILDRHLDAINNLTGSVGSSFMAETFASNLQTIMSRTEKLEEALKGVEAVEDYGTTRLGTQFKQVSSVIKANQVKLNNERDIFYVYIGGWDTHNAFDISGLVTEVDEALEAFTNEMKGEGLWEKVAVVSASDFARTLTDNGVGTDHAWAGNHFITGGSVKGGKVSAATAMTNREMT